MRPIDIALLLALLAAPALSDDGEQDERQAPPAHESLFATDDDELAASYGIGAPPRLDSTPPYGVGAPPSLYGGDE